MSSRKPESKSGDPEAAYREPRFVLEDGSRSDAEKIKLLLDWRQDLLELQTAGAENMPNLSGARASDPSQNPSEPPSVNWLTPLASWADGASVSEISDATR